MSKLSLKRSEKNLTVKSGASIDFAQLAYKGSVEASTIDTFQKGFQDELDKNQKHLIINLDGIEYITSTGLGGLVKYYNLFQENGGNMIIICSTEAVLGVIDLLGLQSLLTIYKDEAELIEKFGGAEPQEKVELSPKQKLSVLRAEATAGNKVKKTDGRKSSEIPVVFALPEDNFFSSLMIDQLKDEGVHVIQADNAKDAYNAIKKNDAAAIIIDYSLKDHEALVTKIKSTSGTSTCSVIHVYAEGQNPDDANHLVMLPNEYVLEPCSTHALTALVKSEIERKKSESTFIRHELHMRFPSMIKFIGKANKMMEKVLEGPLGHEKNTYLAMRSSLREAIDNANRHGNKEDDGKFINVIYILDNEKMTVSVKDCGDGFDYQGVIDSVKGEKATDLAERRNFDSLGGLGIPLMLRCSDVLKYNDQGNEVTQIKYLRKKSSGDEAKKKKKTKKKTA